MTNQTDTIKIIKQPNDIPKSVLEYYQKIKEKSDNHITTDWRERAETDIWRELCFCILSANVSYDLVKSCISVLESEGFLKIPQLINDPNAKENLYKILNSSKFKPLKKDGTLRKYRYPRVRSEQIIKAAFFIYSENQDMKQILNKFKSDIDARNYLAANISGLGMKESSHFLRNIHYSDSLAILDIHILEYMRLQSLIELKKNKSLTKNMYLKIEGVLRNYTKQYKFNLAMFDLAVWHYMRNLNGFNPK